MKPRKSISNGLYLLFLLVVLAAAGEIFARAKGYHGWEPVHHAVKIVPESGLYAIDGTRGYDGKPGTFQVTENDTLHFTVTRNADGRRITRPLEEVKVDRPQIWIFGCSFTHGWGVSDADTYPWKIQEAFPQFDVVNYGMDGYSTLQSLYQLEEALAAGKKPSLVILAYGAFHDQRNVLSRQWTKAVGQFDVLDDLLYPFARLDSLGSLKTSAIALDYKPWPGQQTSAFIHYLESESNRREENGFQAATVTEMLIVRFAEKCSTRKIPFLLAGIYRQDRTTEVLRNAAAKGLRTVDISLDPEDATVFIAGDGHPNAKGHGLFAGRLIPEIRKTIREDY